MHPRWIFAVILGTFPAAAASAQQSHLDMRRQIEQLAATFSERYNRQDAGALANMFTKDAVRVTSGNSAPSVGPQAIEKIFKTQFESGFRHIELVIDQVSPFGTDAAITVGRYEITGRGQAGPLKVDGRWTEVEVREGGVWKIRHSAVVPKIEPNPIAPRMEVNSVTPGIEASPITPRTESDLVSPRIAANSVIPGIEASPIAPRTEGELISPRIAANSVTPGIEASPIAPRLDAKQARPAPTTEATAPRKAGEPIMAIVSISSQQITFYDAEGWILRAPVSTGTTGRETPAGIFAVIEKDKDHHSSLYDDAWMPNMQRITWNGVALHGGPLPGHAASHGCVRMPYDFAEKLFNRTRIGMRVIISPNDEAPVEFSHPALFVPNAQAVAAAPARAETLARQAKEAAKAADEAKKAAATAAREAVSFTASLRKLELLKPRADAELAFADKALAAAKTDQAKARAEELKQKAAAKAAEAGGSSIGPRPTRSRSSTPPPPRRTPPQRPRPRRPPPPRRQARRSSRSSRSRSTSAARRRSFTCGATRISRGRTGARCSMRPLRLRSRSAIPTSRSARMCSRRWRATTRACAGPRSRSTTGTTPRTRSTAHHPAGCARSHRADCIAAILDHRLGRAAEPRDQLSHRVRRGAQQPAPGRLLDAPAYGRCPRCERQPLGQRRLRLLFPAQLELPTCLYAPARGPIL